MFRRVLVANRGEIAVRVVRAIHELGAEAVAIYSEADRDALHVRLADYACCVGPAPAADSYLHAGRVLEAARRSGAEAVHPGYGFLSENPAFARACAEAGLTFVGPSPEAMALMGDKVAARHLAAQAGVPAVPGTAEPVQDDARGRKAAAQIGYPLLIKAAAGGGGKGMRAVRSAEDLPAALAQARSEATSAFGDGRVYLERLVERPRHIEVQLFGDGTGRVEHLRERECSIQRRYQKVVEESPAPNVPEAVRRQVWQAAVAAASTAKYAGAGTIEFLYDPGSEDVYFLEMNARLQVEHPVTEVVTGVDLVQAQLRLAAGESLDDALRLARHGDLGLHAVEARVYAEDPGNSWFPSTGRLELVREPGGPGVRVDSGCEAGQEVTVHYDPLLAKLICWGRSRDEAIARLRRAADEYLVAGVRTTLPFHRWLARDEAFARGELSTSFIAERWRPEATSLLRDGALTAAALAAADDFGARQRAAVFGRSNGAAALAPSLDTSRWRTAARRDALW
jgi:acetyl-CoA carboxylase biotin carboxylase subunit